MESICGAWETFPNRRKEVDGRGLVLGVVKNMQGETVVHSHTYLYHEDVRIIIQMFVAEDAFPPGFTFSSLQFLKDAYAHEHTDPNPRMSVLYSFGCLLYTSQSPRDQRGSRMPSSA